MTNSFTKGPWECQGNEISARYLNGIGDVELIRCVRSGDDRYIAFACLDGITDGPRTSSEERRANARLIAAAPTMFSFIEKMAAGGDTEAIALMGAINGTA